METENTIPYLNSLKPFKFEPKTNIRDITSRSSDDEEEGAECKVKWINNNEWCECSAKALTDLLQNRYQACNFIKEGLQRRCFPMKFAKSLITLFLQNTSTLMAASDSKQCKPMKTYTESLCCQERNIPERYFQS